VAGKDERRRDHYLAKIKEAEAGATASKDEEVRTQWLQIAEGYRVLLRRLALRLKG
jgi:hypothetical protein